MKQKMKKLVIVTSFALLALGAGGCSGNDTTPANFAEQSEIYDTSLFSIRHPLDWDVIEKEDFTSNVPGQAFVAFRDNVKNELLTPNINISMVEVDPNLSSNDFALSNQSKQSSSLISYQELSSEDLSIPAGENTIDAKITTFEGKKTAIEPAVTFQQISVVKGNRGYVVTGAYLSGDTEATQSSITNSLKSFSLK